MTPMSQADVTGLINDKLRERHLPRKTLAVILQVSKPSIYAVCKGTGSPEMTLKVLEYLTKKPWSVRETTVYALKENEFSEN